jgi:gluconate 2-dehydrogenase alpha chain
MAIDLKKADVAIVGLGAVGGVAALPLTRAGLSVVGIAAGSWLTPRDFAPDELRNNFRGWPQSAQKANTEIPTHRPNASAPYTPRLPIHPMMNGVGGTSLHYWAQSWRLNPWDFQVESETTRRYGASRLPKGTTVEDWPFGLDELEPHYDKVEYEVGISGQAGNISGAIDPRGNIFEGPRKRGYPMPPLRGTAFTERMTAAAGRLRWHPFPGPAAVNSEAYDDRPGCQYHGFCNRGGCHVSAKNSTAVSTIPKALATKRLELITQAIATSIAVDERSGRVTGVAFVKGGREFFQPADVVLLASYTYENVRLLLLSKSRAFPKGLSNNRGQAGRHYLSHFQTAPVSTLGTGYRLKGSLSITGPTTTLIILAWTSSAAETCGSTRTGGQSARPACLLTAEYRIGAPSGNPSSRRMSTGSTSPTFRRRRCPTKTTTSTSIPS